MYYAKMHDILRQLPQFRREARHLGEILLANLVMIGEIPAPTFAEEKRVRMLLDRFTMSGLQNCSSDEAGNGFGVLPGREGARRILLVAHADTVFPASVDHTIDIQPGVVRGPGVGDNALGLATLATLPMLLERLNLRLKSDLVLMGGARSLGEGNLGGLRFFLKNTGLPVSAGICVEGARLGRLSYSSIGMLRGEIRCEVPEEYDWTRFGAVGAIQSINEVINRILEIPLPRKPRTSIVFGSISAGNSFNVITTSGVLRFEIRSDSAEMVAGIKKRISDIVAEVSSTVRADVTLKAVALRKPGGLLFSHPLVQNARDVLRKLKLSPRFSPSTSELAAFIDAGIPAVTVGMTSGEHLSEQKESLQIDHVFTGMAQLLGIILALDNGYCDEH